MSELLLNWLNNEVGLSTNVSHFEKDFANGYLFGEVLHKFRQQDDFDDFDNRSTYEAKLANFKRIEPTLKALGIKVNATQSNAMMNGERGASLRLLYQLKMATERLLLACDAPQPKSGGAAQSQVAPPGGGVTKGIRVPRDQFDGHERRFFEHRLRATCPNAKNMRLEKVTRRYDQERTKQEVVAFEMDRLEQAHIAEQREIHRFGLRERLRQNKVAKDEWTRQSIEHWERNMSIKTTREGFDVAFANRVHTNKLESLERTRDGAAADVRDGIDAFEAGLAGLGITRTREQTGVEEDSDADSDLSENQADRLLASTTPAANTRELVGALQARMPNSDELEQEAGLFLQKIKESKRAGSIARKERERRRRRVLVEQQREQDLFEEAKLEEVLLEKLGRESVEERGISYSVWRTQKYEEVIVQNRQLRQQQYAERRKQDQREALQRDQDLLAEMLEAMREQEHRERVRYRAIERGRRAEQRAQWSSECEGILELVSKMAFAAIQQEQLTDSDDVDPALWREWMAMFLEGEPVEANEPLGHCMGPMHPLSAKPEEIAAGEPLSIQEAAALRDYVESAGPWSLAAAEGELQLYDPKEVAARLVEEAASLSFASRISGETDVVGLRPVNYRFGAIAASLLDRKYARPPLPDAPKTPDVPLRLVLTGKPFSGKKTLAARLAEAYNLQVVDLDEVVHECLSLSKRPDISAQPIDTLSVMNLTRDDFCAKEEERGNPYVKQMQAVGYELQAQMDRGEAIDNDLYVHMLVLKIRSLHPEKMAKPQGAAGKEAIDPIVEVEGEDAAAAGEPAGGEAVAAEADADPEAPADEGELEPAGWVLIGFPDDAQRLQLLERFLSGWVQPTATPTPEAEVQKADAALVALAPPVEPPPFVLAPGGYDLHFRLEVHGDEVVRRAVGRRLDPATSLTYHLEDSPPTSKRQIIYERLLPVDGLSNSMGSLTNRIHQFDISQPEVDVVLSHFGPFPDTQRLTRIDAGGSLDEVYTALDEQVAMLLERKRAQHAQALAERAAAAEAAAAALEGDAAGEEQKPEEEAEAQEPEGSRAPSKAESRPAESPAPPPEPEVIALPDLPKFVQKLEEPVFELLLSEWRTLQEDFVTSVRQLFCWHRAHLTDFRSGLHGISQRFASFLQRPDDKQGLVDAFIQSFNAFSEEYPEMRKQDETKAELHQRANDLQEKLHQCVDENRAKSLAELEAIERAQWVEAQVEVVAAQVQHAVRLEARRYFAACQLLNDFYFGAMAMGLPPPIEAPPKINVLGEEEVPETVPDPKAKAKAKAKAKEVEEPKPDDGGASRLRKYEAGEGDAPGHWEFPFLNDLMSQAERVFVNVKEWELPATAEKVETEAPDPKAKAKAKAKAQGRGTPPPDQGTEGAKELPTPALYVDLQQALIAERVTYTHRLAVIKEWARRRLLVVSEAVVDVFAQCRDWALLRRQKELDAIAGLIDIIKEHIEMDPPELINARLTLEGAHLHRHPNVHLQPPAPVVVPPSLEAVAPYRWAISHLNALLDSVASAAQVFAPGARGLPGQAVQALFTRLTQAPNDSLGAKEEPQVPLNWQGCDPDRLDKLCGLFSYATSQGSVDCVELLLQIGLLHSPVGWPSLETLLEVRRCLEPMVPSGSSWPDFWITEEQLATLPLFVDPDGAELAHANENQPVASLTPSAFDRAREQLLWVGRVLKSFPAPLRQTQAWELECAWHDFQVRCCEDHERRVEMLDDTKSESNASPRSPGDGLTPLLAGTQDSALAGSVSDLPLDPSLPHPPPPRPMTPTVPEKPREGTVAVRQLLAYFCLGESVEEGVERALAVLGPSTGATSPIPVRDLHAALLQLGARPTPPPFDGDSRPAYPSLVQFCEGLGVSTGASIRPADFSGHAKAQRLLARFGLGRRHCRAQIETLFTKDQ